jgi:outer membrane protein assembly factor BamA
MNMNKILNSIITWIFLPIWMCSLNAYAQDSLAHKNKLSGFPIIFYTPETSFGFGGAGIYAFRFRKDSAQIYPSQIQFGVAYTTNNQLLLYFPFRIYANNSKYLLYGELGYYRYSYFFYGVGNEQDKDFKEKYSVNFPRIRINILRQLTPDIYLGIRYWYEDFDITERTLDGQLITDEVAGGKGGVTSGLGIVGNWDTRDNLFSPQKGFFLESVIHRNQAELGSEFEYTRYSVDFSQYFSFQKQSVFAYNIFWDWIEGNPPFNQMALLGGTKKMRGFYEGRYRDKKLLLAQLEYRQHLFWRMGMVAFLNYGAVSDKTENFRWDKTRLTYGTGLRFALNPKEKINIRLDAGFGKNSAAYYFTIGEAF